MSGDFNSYRRDTMIWKKNISRTTTPSGVFRQPREDILQESVSQCSLNQDSLCKVSDFDISVNSKYDLPDLYTANGQGRAVYWLYKHSLADSESVRNNKGKSTQSSSENMLINNDCTTNTHTLETIGHLKANSAPIKGKMNKRLCQLRGIILSSTNSDIQIKETYNSYVNLTDIETAEVLLKHNEHLSMDKYDNLMMNLEMRRYILQKKHEEKKAALAKKTGNKNLKYSIEQCLSHIMSSFRKSKKSKTKRHKNRHDDKKLSLHSKSTETDLFVRSGLGINDLDHILNEIRHFMQSGKLNEITEAQKIQLEEYLRALTNESNRKYIKREICQTGISRRLKESIRQSLREIINTTEMIGTNSLRLEADLAAIRCTSSSTTFLKSLKKCEAQYTIALNNSSLSQTDLLENEEMPLDTLRSSNSDMAIDLSEKEMNSADLTETRNYVDEIDLDSNDKLLMKRYQLDREYDLMNFPTSDTATSNDCTMMPTAGKSSKKMDKFKSVRSFNESDTLKYLEMKQREISFKYKEKPEKPDQNICITAPDNISTNSSVGIGGECNTKQEIRKISSGVSTNKAKVAKVKLNEFANQKPMASKSSEDKFAERDMEDNRKMLLKSLNDIYACFKESVQVSSDSTSDVNKLTTFKLKNDHNISSNSFPKARRSEFEGHLKTSNNDRSLLEENFPVKEHKTSERRRRDRKKKDEDENKLALSDNCLNNKSMKIKLALKCGKDGEVIVKDQKEEEKDTGDTTSKIEDRKLDKKLKTNKKSNQKSSPVNPRKSTYEEIKTSRSLHMRKEPLRQHNEELVDKLVFSQHAQYPTHIANCTKSIDSIKQVETSLPKQNSCTSNHVMRINNSLIHIDEKSIFKSTESESMQNFLKNEMLCKLHKTLVLGNCESSTKSVNIPIYKQGYEIARITRQSPSCAYTIKNYVQKINKSTQMFEHVTRNDLYTLQWIHDNLFQINLNPHTLIIDEKIKELSEISDVTSS